LHAEIRGIHERETGIKTEKRERERERERENGAVHACVLVYVNTTCNWESRCTYIWKFLIKFVEKRRLIIAR